MVIFDSVVFFLTLYKAFTFGRGIPLLDVIVRDGASSRVTYSPNLIIISGTMYFSYEPFYLCVDGLVMIHKN